jgi:hypothetical protein
MLNKYFIKDSEGKQSLTATILFVGAMVSFAKLLLSGMVIKGITFGEFSGADFSLVMGSLGGIYTIRRSKMIKDDK